MKKKVLAVTCSVALVFALGACKKKEDKAAMPPAGAPGQGQQLPPGHPAPGGQQGVVMPQGQTTVSVPDSVKGKWKAVTLIIEDKATKKKDEVTVNLNSEYKIPNSNLKLAVSEFLPDFKMDGLTITSVSNDPKNPAVGIKVFEGDKEIFKGWLYKNFPGVHPFEHPKIGLSLKDGVKKG
ncbi:MAG: DUF2155 domain-containing protein [Thermodesulfovibrionales bacterium]